MYLEKKTYVKNWNAKERPDENPHVTLKGRPEIAGKLKPERITYITEEVMYWRKANAIHQWFVTNVQKGNDDQGNYYVSAKKLDELATLCEKIVAATVLKKGKIKNGSTISGGIETPNMEDGEIMDYESAKLASDFLPTTSGFFFGSTDYDSYYFNDIKNTAEKLRALLKEDPDATYYYSSSW